MFVNVRESDRKNEIKVFNYLKEKFPEYFGFEFIHHPDPFAPFDFDFYNNGQHIISLEVKGCGMPYNKLNQFEKTKEEHMRKNASVIHFIAYNYPDGKVKLYCLEESDIWFEVRNQKEHRTGRDRTKEVAIILKATTWDLEGNDSTHFVKDD